MVATFCHSCRQMREPSEATCPACQTPRPHQGWPVDPFIGRLIDGKYRVERRLAAGGFGTVFLATHVHGQHSLGHVVVKFLHSELAHDAAIAKRFVTEAKAARELTSPHVVRVFDLGFSEEGVPFMVQEYITGEGLDALMRKLGPLPIDRVVEITMQIAEAMDEAHSKGILHRDLKPENLRVTPQRDRDFVKVLDFGIARVDSGKSVATNSFIGTPRYMAPEQIKQKVLDGRADVFALGVIMFEMLAGEPPIPADSEMEYIHLNLIAAPRDLRSLRENIPPALGHLVMRMMDKDRDTRPSSMAEVYTELHAMAQLHTDLQSENTGASRVVERGQFKPSTTKKNEGGAKTPAGIRKPALQTGTPAISPAVNTIHPAGVRSNRGILIGGALALIAGAGVLLGLALSRNSNTPTNVATPQPVGVPMPATISSTPAPVPLPPTPVPGPATPSLPLAQAQPGADAGVAATPNATPDAGQSAQITEQPRRTQTKIRPRPRPNPTESIFNQKVRIGGVRGRRMDP